jgi:hypothetical protein
VKQGSGYGTSSSAGALLGEPGVGSPLLGIRTDMGRRLRVQASFSVGAPLGSLRGGGSSTDDILLEEDSGDGHLSL